MFSTSGIPKNKNRLRLSSNSKLVTLMGFLLILGLWVFVFIQVTYDYDRTMAETSRETMNMAKAFEEHVRKIVYEADMKLLALKKACERDGISSMAFADYTNNTVQNPSHNLISVYNENGIIVESLTQSGLGADGSDREYFQIHREADDNRLYFGKPTLGRVTGLYNIPLTRRVNKPDGSFGGIVFIGIRADYFLEYYNKMDLGPDQLTTLTGMDGFLRARQTNEKTNFGEDVRHGALWKDNVQTGRPNGTFTTKAVLDGISRINSYRVMSDYPLIVTVGKSTQVAMAGFEQRKQTSILLASLISIFIFSLCGLLIRRNEKALQLTEAVQQEKDRLSSLISSISDEVWFADTNKNFILANPAASREFRFGTIMPSVEELATSLEVLREDGSSRPVEEAPPLRALSGEAVRNQQEIVRTPVTGELRYREVNANPVHDSEGKIIGSVAVVRDITERKAMEEELVRHRDHLQDLVAERTEKLKTAQDELLLKALDLQALNTALEEEIMERQAAEAALHEMNAELENRVRERTSTLEELNAALEEEIMERQEAGEKRKESEARYRAVIEQASEAVLICNPDTGEILETNRCFSERLGYFLQKDISLNLCELIVDNSENCRDLLDRVARTGSVPVRRSLFRHRNGSILSVERSATMVNCSGRNLFVMTLRDVSEEVRREQEILRDAQMAARVQNALLSIPDSSDFLEIATIYKPLSYVGGDLYFLDWRYDGKLLRGFLIDATGHGLGTALHTASLHVLLREVNERDLPLSGAMRWLNTRAGEYFDEGTFAGALGFEFDLETRQLRWTCAGIPRVWISTKLRKEVVACHGMCLGIQEQETFDLQKMPIDVGDSFYFMTDGLSDMLDKYPDLLQDQYPDAVAMLQRLSELQERRDDATAVCIHVHSLPQALIRKDGWPRILRFEGYGDYQRYKGEVASILSEVTGKPHSMQEVAVHEALANAMECRDGVSRQNKARLRFNKVGKRLIVRVKTSRIGFAGNAILRRLRSQPEDMFSFGEDASMGRGIPMMLSMSHKMTYNSEGTEVLLAWKINGDGRNA